MKQQRSEINSPLVIKEEKLKTLIPTLRVKKRFLKVKIKAYKKLSFEEVSKVLNQEVQFFMGAIDFSQSGFWILKDLFDEKKQELIIKTTTQLKDKVILSLSLLKDIDVEILRVSGTLKGVQK